MSLLLLQNIKGDNVASEVTELFIPSPSQDKLQAIQTLQKLTEFMIYNKDFYWYYFS